MWAYSFHIIKIEIVIQSKFDSILSYPFLLSFNLILNFMIDNLVRTDAVIYDLTIWRYVPLPIKILKYEQINSYN